MPLISTTTLANGARVELSTTEFTRNGDVRLVLRLLDAHGGVVRSANIDTQRSLFNDDGSPFGG